MTYHIIGRLIIESDIKSFLLTALDLAFDEFSENNLPIEKRKELKARLEKVA